MSFAGKEGPGCIKGRRIEKVNDDFREMDKGQAIELRPR